MTSPRTAFLVVPAVLWAALATVASAGDPVELLLDPPIQPAPAWQQDTPALTTYTTSSVCSRACGSPYDNHGLYGGVDIAMLKPHLGTPELAGTELLPTFGCEVSPRLWLGYETCDGFGGRARFWIFDHTAEGGDALFNATQGQMGLTSSVEAATVDLEFTQEASFRRWNLGLFGGMRYGKSGQRIGLQASNAERLAADLDFEGIGPTLGLDARRPVGCRGFALVGSLRGSFLFGSTRAGIHDPGNLLEDLIGIPADDIRLRFNDHFMQTWETQLGIEWTRRTCCGNRFLVRGALEAQVWDSGAMVGLLSSETGFVGPTITIGLSR